MLTSRKKNELVKLVKKVLNGKATLKEEQFVERYYDYFNHERFEPDILSPDERKELEDKILQNIYFRIEALGNYGRNVVWFKTTLFKIAVACIFFAIFVGYFYWHQDVSKKESIVTSQGNKHPDNNILPGGSKAILTLSNGSQIMLGNANNGTIAVQGSSQILKMNGGQLAYKIQSSANQSLSSRNKNKELTPTQYNTLTVPRGGKYQLSLPDGSRVWLNSASSLTFPTAFKGRERKVNLTGEAYFEIAENKNKPFEVLAGNVEIKDLGTHFNVMAYPDEANVEATLLEGSVKIIRGNTRCLLKPGEQAIVHGLNDDKIEVERVDTNMAVAWKNGLFSFHSTNIYEIMRQISRWYNVDIHYDDSLHVFLNGDISRDVDASEVFKMLELTGEINFIIDGKKVIVKKDRL